MLIILLGKISKPLDYPPTPSELNSANVFIFLDLTKSEKHKSYKLAHNKFSRANFLHPNLPITSNSQPGLSDYLKNIKHKKEAMHMARMTEKAAQIFCADI